MEKTILTPKELAQRWGVHEVTIRRYGQEGTLTKAKVPGGVFFSLDYIESLEQCEQLDPMSPLERRKLINKIEELQQNNEKLEKALTQVKIIALQTSLYIQGGEI